MTMHPYTSEFFGVAFHMSPEGGLNSHLWNCGKMLHFCSKDLKGIEWASSISRALTCGQEVQKKYQLLLHCTITPAAQQQPETAAAPMCPTTLSFWLLCYISGLDSKRRLSSRWIWGLNSVTSLAWTSSVTLGKSGQNLSPLQAFNIDTTASKN